MTRGEIFMKNAQCKNEHCSSTSNSAWCGSHSNVVILKIHDFCHNPKCKCQKQISFTPKQFHLEGSGFKNTFKMFSKGS